MGLLRARPMALFAWKSLSPGMPALALVARAVSFADSRPLLPQSRFANLRFAFFYSKLKTYDLGLPSAGGSNNFSSIATFCCTCSTYIVKLPFGRVSVHRYGIFTASISL
jgi:hypothetical protein